MSSVEEDNRAHPDCLGLFLKNNKKELSPVEPSKDKKTRKG
jgi:hypothetical protein